MDIVDAEIIEDPCQCECADCTAGKHCDRASCAQGQVVSVEDWNRATVIDGEVLGEAWTDSYSTAGELQAGPGARHARWVDHRQADNVVRVVPTGRECWWRLYSTTDSPLRERAQDHGVRDTIAYADQPHCLTLVFDNGTMDVVAMEFKVNATEADPGVPRAIECKGRFAVALRGPASIDILAEYPPTLPEYPRHWQQLTLPGEFKHPGNNRSNWRFSDKDWTYNPYYGFGDPQRDCGTDNQRVPPRGFGISANGVQRTTPANLKALRGGE